MGEGATRAGEGHDGTTGQPVASDPTTGDERLAELEAVVRDLQERVADVHSSDTDQHALLASLVEERRRTRRQRLVDSGAAIALLALVFSLVTFVSDQRRADREARREARNELSRLVQRINEQVIQQVEVTPTLPAAGAVSVGGSFTALQLVLLGQAERILAEHPDIATPLDYVTLAQARTGISDLHGAGAYYERARAMITDADRGVPSEQITIELAAVRGLGHVRYLLGDVQRGRALYAEAIERPDRRADVTPLIREFHEFQTRVNWMTSEIFAGDCDAAVEQLEALDEVLRSSLNPRAYVGVVDQQVEFALGALMAACPGVRIDTGLLPALTALGSGA